MSAKPSVNAVKQNSRNLRRHRKTQSRKSTVSTYNLQRSYRTLKTQKPALDWGSDLGYEDEKVLAEDFGKPFFVYDYPTAIKAFYCKTYRDHQKSPCQWT